MLCKKLLLGAEVDLVRVKARVKARVGEQK